MSMVATTRSEPENTGRVVFVTGGTRGIGRATAQAFSANGDRVVVSNRKNQPCAVRSVPCDVTSTPDVVAAFDEIETTLGPVEVLVANAGITSDGLLLSMTEESFTSVIDTNLVGTFRVVKQAARRMVRARRGRIILLSSVVGMSGSGGQANYAASKAGVVGFGRSLARELASRGITVNIVAPGFIDTDMTAVLPEKHRRAILAQVPLARAGRAEDVASTVVWLASPAASYVTGAVIPVDGGLGMGH
jgi:3-oxoacyl-[acyl-carrier protein] reductase